MRENIQGYGEYHRRVLLRRYRVQGLKYGNRVKHRLNILNDLSSCINHCGNISEAFKVGRSCRQGDPISPYLFILCAEILALRIRKDPGVTGFKIGNWEHKLDMYADDLTAYLDGSERSLRNLIGILDSFQELSGLKINLGKCKAVWIGRNRFSRVKLCEDLKLIWDDCFTLLGIELDSDLAKMDTNFRKKMDEIEGLYKSWLYRNLTPMGKITVIKSLALSKLSHVVLVCPHLGDNMVKSLTKISFQFLWSNKPDRMKQTEAVLPISLGGLNMPDIGAFWDSLKCSWTRRLMNHGTAWHKILQANIIYHGYDIDDIIFGGPEKLIQISNKISNLFWKNALLSFANLENRVAFHKPDYFFNMNFFENKLFKYGDNRVKKSDFSILWDAKIRQVGDLFDCSMEPPKILNSQELNRKYNIQLDFLSYNKIKTSINSAANKLNHKIYDPMKSDCKTPRLPILFKIAIQVSKGCSAFYAIFRSKENMNRNTSTSETKWQAKLSTTFSINFWDKIFKIPQKMLVDNKIIWTQIQINKHLLPTNYTVNKYDNSVNPACSFCQIHPEELHFLMWGCGVVRQFWAMVENMIANFYPRFVLGRKEAIFGHFGSDGNSIFNTLLVLSRYFIWKMKFTKNILDEVDYLNYIKQKLELIHYCIKAKEKQKEFNDEWKLILNHFDIDF